MFYIHLFILTITGAFIHLSAQKKALTARRVVEVTLLYFIALYCGVAQLTPGLLHIALPDVMAAHTGWPAGNPFQSQLGFAHVAFAVLGLLCTRIRGNFWTATILGYAMFMSGAAVVHIDDFLVRRNFSPGNFGVELASDLVIPVILLGLLFLYLRLPGPAAENNGELKVIVPEQAESLG